MDAYLSQGYYRESETQTTSSRILIWFVESIEVGDLSREWPEASLFDSYYTNM